MHITLAGIKPALLALGTSGALAAAGCGGVGAMPPTGPRRQRSSCSIVTAGLMSR